MESNSDTGIFVFLGAMLFIVVAGNLYGWYLNRKDKERGR